MNYDDLKKFLVRDSSGAIVMQNNGLNPKSKKLISNNQAVAGFLKGDGTDVVKK